MKASGYFILLTSLFFMAKIGIANDSSADIGIGGLQPVQNKTIVMAKEVLHVNLDKIQIAYEFQNPSAKDVEVTIAFPLPEIKVEDIEWLISTLRNSEQKDPAKLVNFTVEVDGKKVAYQTEQKAWQGNKDITTLLKKHRLPIIPWYPESDSYRSALRALNAKDKQSLIDAGLISKDSLTQDMSDSGNGPEWEPHFSYVVKTQYYWPQRFPKNTVVKIRHSYKPLTGQFFGLASLSHIEKDLIDAGKTPAEVKALAPKALAEEAKNEPHKSLCAAGNDYLTAKLDPNRPSPCTVTETLSYILTTAKTWNGPIRDFELKIDKAPYLFTCFPGIKRTGKDTWEMRAKNFVPTKELGIGVCRFTGG